MTASQQGQEPAYGPPTPGSYFHAAGEFGGRPASLNWDGYWTASEPALLHLFLSYMMLEGWGDGETREMHVPPGIMGFGVAAEAAARETLGDQVVIDYEFEDAPEGAVGAPAA